MKKTLFILLTMLLLSACSLSDCQDMLYSTGPPILRIEFVDKDSGENVFTNGTYEEIDIEIINENDVNVEFNFIDENDLNIINFTPYSYSEKNVIFLKLDDEVNAKITFDVIEYSSECFTNFLIENVEVENYSYEQEANSDLLKIMI